MWQILQLNCLGIEAGTNIAIWFHTAYNGSWLLECPRVGGSPATACLPLCHSLTVINRILHWPCAPLSVYVNVQRWSILVASCNRWLTCSHRQKMIGDAAENSTVWLMSLSHVLFKPTSFISGYERSEFRYCLSVPAPTRLINGISCTSRKQTACLKWNITQGYEDIPTNGQPNIDVDNQQ